MDILADPSFNEEDMNKDHLLIKCREVIESLNCEIEEERVALKIVKEENERLKDADSELYKYKNEYEEMMKRISELEEYCEENKAQTHAFFEKMNLDFNRKLDPYLCTCHELKAEGLSPDYKCVYCLANKQIKAVKSELSHKFKSEIEKIKESHNDALISKEETINVQSQKLKSLNEDLSKAQKEAERNLSLNESLNLRISEIHHKTLGLLKFGEESELDKSQVKNDLLRTKLNI